MKRMSSTSSSSRPNVTDDDLKDAVKDLTPASTQEIADRVGLTRQAVEYRLKQSDDRRENPVWSKKIGPTRVGIHHHHF